VDQNITLPGFAYGEGCDRQVPDRLTVLVPALVEITDKVPVRLVLPVGANVTAMLHAEPTARLAGQVFVCVKNGAPAVIPMLPMATAAVPVFVAETPAVTGPP
jgi:hypothetical protein